MTSKSVTETGYRSGYSECSIKATLIDIAVFCNCISCVSQKSKENGVSSTTVTIRLDNDEKNLIANFAAAIGTSISDFMRKATLELIEDELDLKAWEEAKAEFDADPETISAADIAKKYL